MFSGPRPLAMAEAKPAPEAASEARDVPAPAERRALVRVDRVVEAADDLPDPWQPVAQDPFDAALEGRRTDRTRAAGPLELDLDDAGLDVRADEHEVAAVGLHRRAHQLDERPELAEPLRSFLVAQRGGAGAAGRRVTGSG